MESVRWCFNFSNWRPTRAEWLLAGRCVQPEEKTRIGRFVFTKDAKAAMAGRLMIRKLFCEKLKLDYTDIRLDRSDKGKPFLINSLPKWIPSTFSFNLSHHGKFVVLAAEPDCHVGIDVMRVEYPGSKSVADFFRTMNRQFTTHEWNQIFVTIDELQQLSRFYRFWCLKESYVKAVGIGIGYSLQRLSFTPNTHEIRPQTQINDTRLQIDGKEIENWVFEETMLDEEHWVSTALGKKNKTEPTGFDTLNFTDIISCAVPWQSEDDMFWEEFAQKEEKPSFPIVR